MISLTKPKAVREAMEAEQLTELMANMIQAYIQEHPETSLASVSLAIKLLDANLINLLYNAGQEAGDG